MTIPLIVWAPVPPVIITFLFIVFFPSEVPKGKSIHGCQRPQTESGIPPHLLLVSFAMFPFICICSPPCCCYPTLLLYRLPPTVSQTLPDRLRALRGAAEGGEDGVSRVQAAHPGCHRELHLLTLDRSTRCCVIANFISLIVQYMEPHLDP